MTRPEAVRVWLLGGFKVSVGPRTIEGRAWRRKKAAALVKLLALAPGHRLHREQAMDLLWPYLGRRAASNNLRQVVHAARRTLAPAKGSHYLASDNEWLVLCPGGNLWVDVEAFEEAAVSVHLSRDPVVYRRAIELYAGELLPGDRYEEWAEEKRVGLRTTYLKLLVDLAVLYEEHGEYGQAVEVLRRAVAHEPTLEEAHASLMRLYALSGKQGQALAQYERLRAALSGWLNTEPRASTRALYDEIAAGRFSPTPPTGLPPEEPLDAGKHNLPAARTKFVGRKREMVEVKRTLAMTGLLTLTGAGGCGKTRLALEVTRDLVGTYADGVWIVELAPLSDRALVPQAVAATLGVREQPGRSLLETLLDALRDKEMLLILDNCEHLIGAAARLAKTLLVSCPRLRVLATSREAMNVDDEVVWQVDPLSVPGEQDRPTADELEGYESVQLFLERALFMERVLYGSTEFALRPGNAWAVAGICRRLEGIPLAIELAAAWVGTLTTEQISERLKVSLGLLKGDRTLTRRQRTLRGAMDWSYELLSEPERTLFRQLSLFAGGWTLDACEAIGAGNSVKDEEILDLLWRLVNKSLVVAETGTEETARYRMLEPIRQYAREKLQESGEAEQTTRRHAEWYLALAEEAEKESDGLGHVRWLPRLEIEHDNLRVALGWSIGEKGDAELGLRLAGALWLFWFTQGYSSEGWGWLERGLSLGASKAARAKALNGAGWIVLFQGDSETAKRFLEESVTLYREQKDEEGLASSLNFLGFVALLGGREDIPAAALLEEALALKPQIKNHQTIANTLVFAALDALLLRDDWEESVALHEEALALFREIDDRWGMGLCLTNLGLIIAAMGDHTRATRLLQELMYRSRELGDKFGNQYSFFGLACVADSEGHTVRAARLWGVSEAIREAAGFRLPHAALSVMKYEGRLADARARLGEAVFEAAWAAGKAMTPEEAAEYALSEERSAPPTSPRPEKPLSSEPLSELTRREREVAILAARGLTNRQISAELGISERTAGNHVASILRKLGLGSRAQIAGEAAERRQLVPYQD